MDKHLAALDAFIEALLCSFSYKDVLFFCPCASLACFGYF